MRTILGISIVLVTCSFAGCGTWHGMKDWEEVAHADVFLGGEDGPFYVHYGEDAEPLTRIHELRPLESPALQHVFPESRFLLMVAGGDYLHYAFVHCLVWEENDPLPRILLNDLDVFSFLGKRVGLPQTEVEIQRFLDLFAALRNYELVETIPKKPDAMGRSLEENQFGLEIRDVPQGTRFSASFMTNWRSGAIDRYTFLVRPHQEPEDVRGDGVMFRLPKARMVLKEPEEIYLRNFIR